VPLDGCNLTRSDLGEGGDKQGNSSRHVILCTWKGLFASSLDKAQAISGDPPRFGKGCGSRPISYSDKDDPAAGKKKRGTRGQGSSFGEGKPFVGTRTPATDKSTRTKGNRPTKRSMTSSDVGGRGGGENKGSSGKSKPTHAE